jgi:hypothetical protein
MEILNQKDKIEIGSHNLPIVNIFQSIMFYRFSYIFFFLQNGISIDIY